MSWYDYSRDRSGDLARVEREIAKRRKRGEPFVQVECEVARGIPCRTFWGKAWCQNLEAYKDYAYRLPRGRAYLRKGNVYDPTIDPGEVFAYVAGTGLYEVTIRIDPMRDEDWANLTKSTTSEVTNLVDLLEGKLGAGVMQAITDPDTGMFPKPEEIEFNCTCPDWADMCKHVASVMYGIGVLFDRQPELLFKLRQVKHEELIGVAGSNAGALTSSDDASTSVLKPDELSELFGIEITDPEAAF